MHRPHNLTATSHSCKQISNTMHALTAAQCCSVLPDQWGGLLHCMTTFPFGITSMFTKSQMTKHTRFALRSQQAILRSYIHQELQRHAWVTVRGCSVLHGGHAELGHNLRGRQIGSIQVGGPCVVTRAAVACSGAEMSAAPASKPVAVGPRAPAGAMGTAAGMGEWIRTPSEGLTPKGGASEGAEVQPSWP